MMLKFLIFALFVLLPGFHCRDIVIPANKCIKSDTLTAEQLIQDQTTFIDASLCVNSYVRLEASVMIFFCRFTYVISTFQTYN